MPVKQKLPLDTQVVRYWENHGAILPVVLELRSDLIKELLDAVPWGMYPHLKNRLQELIYMNADK